METRLRDVSREYRLLLAGQGCSWIGDGFQTVALAVAVVLAGHGANGLGLVLASMILARLACTLLGGVWADRLQPQRVMIASDLVRAVTAGVLALTFATGHASILVVCLLAAVMGGAGAVFFPAMSSLKPMLVAPSQRQAANALLGLLQTICTVVGPAAGGFVVAAFGASAGFAVNGATFLVSVSSIVFIKTVAVRGERAGMFHEIGEGWTEIRRRDWLLSGVLAATVYHVANGVILVLVQVVAIERLGGASALGVIAAAEGVGGLCGAAIAMRFRPARLMRAGWLALFAMPLWALSYVWPGALVAVLLGAAIGYAGLSFFSVAWDTALQDHVPHRLLARVTSWDMLTSFIGMPLGNALAGPLSSAFGLNVVLVACALVLLGASAGPLFVRGTRTLTRPAVDPSTDAGKHREHALADAG